MPWPRPWLPPPRLTELMDARARQPSRGCPPEPEWPHCSTLYFRRAGDAGCLISSSRRRVGCALLLDIDATRHPRTRLPRFAEIPFEAFPVDTAPRTALALPSECCCTVSRCSAPRVVLVRVGLEKGEKNSLGWEIKVKGSGSWIHGGEGALYWAARHGNAVCQLIQRQMLTEPARWRGPSTNLNARTRRQRRQRGPCFVST